MSATFRQLSFGITVEDVEHWNPENRGLADSDDSFSAYDDWVVEQLHEVMANAGSEFIANHPDLFRTTELS